MYKRKVKSSVYVKPRPRRLGGEGSGRKKTVLEKVMYNDPEYAGIGSSASAMTNNFIKSFVPRPKLGIPHVNRSLIQTSYKTFSKSADYDKKKAIDFFSAIKNPQYALPLPNSLGVFTTANFSKRAQITSPTTAGNTSYMILQFTASQVCAITYTQIGTTAINNAICTIVSYADLDTSAPANIRASRMTLTLINATSSQNVAGSISTLYLNNGLEWEFSASTTNLEVTPAFQNEINTMIDSNSRSKLHSANKFIGDSDNNRFHLIPSSMANLEEWRVYANGTADINSTKSALVLGAQNFTHSTLVIRFDQSSVANTYTALINAQYALRYPANNIISSIAQKQPSPDKGKIEKMTSILDGDGQYTGPSTTGWHDNPISNIEHGFNKAYNNHSNRYYYDNSNGYLFIAGTDPTDINDLIADVKIPIGILHTTDRFKKADQIVQLYKPNKLYGHSLGGQIVKLLGDKYKIPYETYSSPNISMPWENVPNRFKHPLDPISILDMGAQTKTLSTNPHSYKGFDR